MMVSDDDEKQVAVAVAHPDATKTNAKEVEDSKTTSSPSPLQERSNSISNSSVRTSKSFRTDKSEDNDENGEKEKESSVNTLTPSFSKIVQLAKPELAMLVLALLLMICAESTGLITPLIIANAYDSLVDPTIVDNDERLEDINSYMLLAVIVHGAGVIAGFFRASILGIAGERLVARLRTQLYQSILKQEISFFDSTKSGELVSRLSSDTTLLQAVISQSFPESLLGMLKVVVSVILMFWISPKLAGLTLGMVFVLLLFSVPMGTLLGKLSKEYQNALGEAQTHSTEALGAIRTVQSFAAEVREVNRYVSKIGDPDVYRWWFPTSSSSSNSSTKDNGPDSKTTYSVGFYKATTTAGFFTFIFGFGFGAMYLMLWYGFHLVTEGQLSLGQLTAFQSYIFTVGFSLGTTSAHIAKAIEGFGASGRIFYLLERIPLIPTPIMDENSSRNDKQKKDEIVKEKPVTKTNNADAEDDTYGSSKDVEQATPPPFRPTLPLQKPNSMEGVVTFQNVQFAYPTRPNVPVLEDFTLTVPANTTAALCGSSGSGKSTCVNLLQRFYEVTGGSIQVDGIDIRNLDVHWLRRHIGYVQQEPQLFGLTIRENVLYGVDRDDVTQEEIEEACRNANAHDFVMAWPNGYETLVGERGVKLSGGQKQRLAIARALLTRCRILLLDEATSALDAESEHLVQEAIDKAVEGRTVLIVAHRLSTIRRANQIVVLDKHRIADVGTHDELLSRCDKYKDLIKRQQGHGK